MDSIFTIEDRLNLPMLQLPIRSTVVKTTKGVVIISPTKNLSEYKDKIDAMGEVIAIVSPNLFHNLYLSRAKRLYPAAQLWGAKGLDRKVKNLNVDLYFGEAPWPYDADLKAIVLQGIPGFREVVFVHKNSGTLITTDLCFNLKEDPKNLMGKLLLSTFGTRNRFAVSRLFSLFVRDKKAFVDSIEVVFKETFDRVIMAHGEIITKDGKSLLREILILRGFAV